MFGDNKLGTTGGVSPVKYIGGVRPEFWDICHRQLTIGDIVFSFDRILGLKTIYFATGESNLT